MDFQYIIKHLPYSEPFLFVDNLLSVNEKSVEGTYTFPKNAFFYKGHFKGHPVTPGVLLTECCAQIGLVCLGIYLLSDSSQKTAFPKSNIAMTSAEMEYYAPVYPEETVTVFSEKIYYRFNKLKCKVNMYNESQVLVCKGILSGMIKP